MRHFWTGLSIAACAASTLVLAAPAREIRAHRVSVAGKLPIDLTQPEGKSRWHLEGVPLDPAPRIVRKEAGEGGDRGRWVAPEGDAVQMRMGAHVLLSFDEVRDGLADHLTARVDTVGIGWLHLPSGPREVVLQRALLLRQRAGERATRPDVLVHRWVDPRTGIVAEVSGPASGDGRERLAIGDAWVADEVVTGAADLKIYENQLDRGLFVDMLYGWDKGPGFAVPSLVTNPGVVNMCDLVNLPSWDFSANTAGKEVAQISAPVNASETCNNVQCGYGVSGGVLGRADRDLTGTLRKDNQVTQRENRPSDVTIWLRAGTQNENKSGLFGSGESRFCYNTEGGKTRQSVPLWRFSHNDSDGKGYYLLAGDNWASGSFACEENLYTLKCGVTQPLTPNPLWAKACGDHKGNQRIEVIKGGVLTLPSGHTLNSLVVRNTADFCVYTANNCLFNTDSVRTVIYYWQVPFLGSVVLLRSPQNVNFGGSEDPAPPTATPCTNYTTVDFTSIGFGLFPPTSIATGTIADNSIQISWTPGNDTHRIVGYKVYWDTDSGSATPYAFNSVANPGQVAFAGTTATVSGLTAATPYYFTVTSLSDFTDPSTSVTTRYESIVYPTTVSGDPSFSYPVEVTATTTGACIPTQQVTGLTVDKSSPDVHVCWTPTADVCAVGYDVLASDVVINDAGWTVVGQTGLTTCWDGNPAQKYLLVRARGTGGNGPWGHYGH